MKNFKVYYYFFLLLALTTAMQRIAAQSAAVNNINIGTSAISNDERYYIRISKARVALDAKDSAEAKKQYQDAITFRPGDKFALLQIEKIDNSPLLINQSPEIKSNRKDNYNRLVRKADIEYNQANYSEAKIIFTEALMLSVKDEYLKKMIQKIDDLLGQPKNDLIDEANKLLNKAYSTNRIEDYELAIEKYKGAITSNPDQSKWLKTILQTMQEKVTSIKKDDIANRIAILQQKYDAAIYKGIKGKADKKYGEALEAFNDALYILADSLIVAANFKQWNIPGIKRDIEICESQLKKSVLQGQLIQSAKTTLQSAKDTLKKN